MNKIREEYIKNGFILLKNFYNIDEVKDMQMLVKKEIAHYENQLDSRYSHRVEGKINSIHKLQNEESLNKYQNSKKILNIVEYLMGQKPVSFGSEVFVKPAKGGLEVPPHQDNHYWCIDLDFGITVWIALENSGKKNGGVYYLVNSHIDGKYEHENSGAPGSSQKIKHLDHLFKKYEKVTPEMEAGDVLIHHAMVIHGSEKNISGHGRCGLTLRYIPADGRIDEKEKNKYEKNLKLQLKERGEL